MRLYRIILVIVSVITALSVPMFVAMLEKQIAKTGGISGAAALFVGGYILLLVASPWLWFFKKTGIIILTASVITAFLGAFFGRFSAGVFESLLYALNMTVFQGCLLLVTVLRIYGYPK